MKFSILHPMVQAALTAGMLTLALAGCATPALQTKRDPDFKGKIDRLYVLVFHGPMGDRYSEALAEALSPLLAEAGVESRVRILSALELDPNRFYGEIGEFKPDAGLRIVATGGGISPTGAHPLIHYEASVYTFPNRKVVWRAQMDSVTGAFSMESRMRQVAQRIVGGLRDDGLLKASASP